MLLSISKTVRQSWTREVPYNKVYYKGKQNSAAETISIGRSLKEILRKRRKKINEKRENKEGARLKLGVVGLVRDPNVAVNYLPTVNVSISLL